MFNLLRYFSLTSAAVILVIAFAMHAAFRHNAVADLIAMAERHNVALAQAFTNTLWAQYASHVKSVTGSDGDQLRAHPETRKIHAELTALTAGLPVLKVKIYNLDGLTVYSSQASQMGEDKSRNPGFLSAGRDGKSASKMSYRDSFSAFSSVVYGRDVVETYIPIRSEAGGIEGAFELYTDVTPLVARIGTKSTLFITGLLLLFGLLYTILFLVVRRADRILKSQYAGLQSSEKDIKAKNVALEHEIGERRRVEEELREIRESLEQRVAERTARLEENERYLRTARDQADAANRAKSEFLAAMSHELRTPLNAIIGFSEIIKNQVFGPHGSPRYTDYGADIHMSGCHLLDLINDILDLSKIEYGATELETESIVISDLVSSVVTLVRQRADMRGLDLDLEMRDPLPSLQADKRKLKQILVNLLSNAIKFTESGGRVALKAWYDTDVGHVFQISDTGIGIAPEEIPTAMARFGQVDSDLNRKYEGTGLGLSLTKALVELHGGTLDLQSEVGAGTTVTVTFPAALPATGARQDVRPDSDAAIRRAS